MTEPLSVATMLGNEFTFQLGSDASPPEFTNFCAVIDTGGIGESKPLVDVTSMCDTAHTYRPGLADGSSIPLKCNFTQGDTLVRSLYQQYKANALAVFRLKLDDTSPEEYFQFEAIITDWKLTTPVGNKSDITFTMKVSGEVTWVYHT